MILEMPRLPDPWDTLSLYESTELVSQFYHERHGVKPAPAKAWAIASHLTQGHQYFRSSRDADDLVRPLLLYYGVLALSRGLIIFRSPDPLSPNYDEGHGLRAMRWEDGLTQGAAGVRRITHLSMSVSKGTFTQLANSTENVERVLLLDVEPTYNMADWIKAGTTYINPRQKPTQTITIGQVLERIPDLMDLYERTFRRHARCCAAVVKLDESSKRLMVGFGRSDLGLQSDQRIRQIAGIGRTIALAHSPVLMRGWTGMDPNRTYERTYATDEELVAIFPSVKQNDMGDRFIVQPFPSGLDLSTLSILYAASYAVGMLVRYFAPVWSSLVSRRRGDLTYPLLKAATAAVEQRFPKLVLQELQDDRSRGLKLRT
jgi:hypothetical protein